jgi:hypothetical protein
VRSDKAAARLEDQRLAREKWDIEKEKWNIEKQKVNMEKHKLDVETQLVEAKRIEQSNKNRSENLLFKVELMKQYKEMKTLGFSDDVIAEMVDDLKPIIEKMKKCGDS